MAKDWKEVLLRSGAPLEYEVAQTLARAGFEVDADFSYMRKDVEGVKEHSVDMLATWWPRGKFKSHHPLIFLLIECKYRSPEKKLLLFQNPHPNQTPVRVGGTIHAYDELVPYYVKGDCFMDFERELPFVYKGVELHTNDAMERDFRRSIEQLRYAAPLALLHAMEMTICSHAADNFSIFLAKVVVTNAPILVVEEDVCIREIVAAEAIEDVTFTANGAVLYSDNGPDYERHFRGVFEDVHKEWVRRGRAIRKYVKQQGKKVDSLSDPVKFLDEMCEGRRGAMCDISTQFYVWRSQALPALLAELVQGTKKAYAGRKQVSALWRSQKREKQEDKAKKKA